MTDTATKGQTKTEGAIKAGDQGQGHIFNMAELGKIEAGKGYSTAFGSVVEGERTQVGLIRKAKGTGARPHNHPNEQWNYVLQGKLRVNIEGEEERIVGPGTLLFFPAGKTHSTVALPEEDVLFFVVKDLSHGIIGMAADGQMSGGYFEKGYEDSK